MSNYAVMPMTDFVSVCETVREKTGNTETIKSGELPAKVDDVFTAGKKSEYDRIWDGIQEHGQRTVYHYGFSNTWDSDTFKPKYDMKPTDARYMFYNNKANVDLRDLLNRQGIVLDLSDVSYNMFGYMFASSKFTALPTVDLRGCTTSSTNNGIFGWTHNLHTIDAIILEDDGSTVIGTSWFSTADALKNLVIVGLIGNSIDFSYSPLSPESMKSVITHLKNYAGTDNELLHTVRFSKNRWAALEADSTAPNGDTWEEYVTSLGWNV